MKVKADRDEASPYAAMLAAQVLLLLLLFSINIFLLCSLKKVDILQIVFIYSNNNLNNNLTDIRSLLPFIENIFF